MYKHFPKSNNHVKNFTLRSKELFYNNSDQVFLFLMNCVKLTVVDQNIIIEEVNLAMSVRNSRACFEFSNTCFIFSIFPKIIK